MPDLVIGIGGAGREVCRRLALRLGSLAPEEGGLDRPALMCVDTDRTAGDGCLALTASAAVLDAAARSPERFRAEWLDPEVLRGRGSVEDGARGSRMLARLLFLLPDNAERVRAELARWISEGERPGRLWVVASAAGGTGGGLLADMGYLAAQVAEATERTVERRALLFLPSGGDAGAANALAALTELHYYADPATLYQAHLGSGDEPYTTRSAPFERVLLLPAVTVEGEPVPLAEQQERAAVYLLTATCGDDGAWSSERSEREAAVARTDADGNPQMFGTLGMEWVEYPEARLARGVYRNLLRRSVLGWLQGDRPLPRRSTGGVPLQDAAKLAESLSGFERSAEDLLRPLSTRLPWIHRAPQHQWIAMDGDLEAALREAAGPEAGPTRGPFADRMRALRETAISERRAEARTWLSAEQTHLDRSARGLQEWISELTTVADPAGRWDTARDLAKQAKHRILWAAAAVRKDPFLLFYRRAALRKLALEYERIAGHYAEHVLQAQSLSYMRDLRQQVLEPLRAWSARTGELSTALAERSRAWAAEESALLEGLREEEEQGRLALGLIRLPGRETPFVANTGWDLAYATPDDEARTISTLRDGWVERLVEREDGLLAPPTRSALDGGPTRVREALDVLDDTLRNRASDAIGGWLSATALQRLAEQYRDPVELEFHLRRIVAGSSDLPALDPPEARPADLAPEYQVVFFGAGKETEVPSALRIVVEEASRKRPVRIARARSEQYLSAVTEHPGFSLARCPAYHHLLEAGLEPAFGRVDLPWRSATLLTRVRLRDAADVLFLALAFNVLRPGPDGAVPLPGSLLEASSAEPRMPLPGEWDRAVRQLAGDVPALQAVALAVDRTFQARGAEWCALQVERGVGGLVLGAGEPQLVALRAVGRYEDLLEEYARSTTAQDAEWLRAGDVYRCPACEQVLGVEANTLPAACPRCRELLLPHRMPGFAAADGFRRIPNPYVVGTPLEAGANVFVGRDDIIQQVRERLVRPAQRTILILIGERRSGKTSALKQLQYRLEGDLTPLFVDMQGLTATDLSGFLWWLAWRMREALDERGITVDLPSFDQFSSGPPDFQFETVILPEVRRKLGGGRVLLMLDEFEVLAQRVMNGTFDGRAFDYLRHLMQHSDGLEFLFAGTHVLRQFAANYVTFLFNIGVFLDVDFLTPAAALRLIQEPVAAAGVTYTTEAQEAVLELAGAHPYFTQLFGFHLVERLNRLRKRDVTREDVEAESGPVIAAAGAHLDHVWGQLGPTERLMASYFVEQRDRGAEYTDVDFLNDALREDSSLRPYLFRGSLDRLVTAGLLRQVGEDETGRRFTLTAEVYRRWLKEAHPYRRLREEGLSWS
jgi:hypothetical protein